MSLFVVLPLQVECKKYGLAVFSGENKLFISSNYDGEFRYFHDEVTPNKTFKKFIHC